MSGETDNRPLQDTAETPNANKVVKEYLLEHVREFRELIELKERGWQNPAGDEHFKKQRDQADNASISQKKALYRMMCQIGDELHSKTLALSLHSEPGENPSVLDLCMAPGGFTASVLKRNPNAEVYGISLPEDRGGHTVLLPNWHRDSRLEISFQDITMLAAEMDVTDIPPEHPDAANFSFDRPFYPGEFDLVFCDGQVLRTHSRAEYREKREAWRLLTSQLVLALQRVKEGGKIIMLLHKVDCYGTAELLHTFSKFSALRLFKPERKHAIRSSFYLIAEEVQSQSEEALQAVAAWKKGWHTATFGSDADYAKNRYGEEEEARDMLRDFGGQLIRLGRPVWIIQSVALRKASFIE